MIHYADVAVVGGGILGLAFAYAAGRRGRKVVLFERDRQAQGASVRNFGMIWPIGQEPGPPLEQALRSRRHWLEIAKQAGIWHAPCGSLHLAYRSDELAVLEEFINWAELHGYQCRLLTAAEAQRRCPAVQPDGLLGALWSETEVCIDPRQAVARLPHWLHETFGVELRYGVAVRSIDFPRLEASHGEQWQVERVVVCNGTDFATLFPEVFRTTDLRLCKLQMLRTCPQPDGWRLGTLIAGGLTLCHYPSFHRCRSLTALRQRIETELPEYVRYGIHVMAAQNGRGEVVIGDSHEYDDAITPFDKVAIDDLIMRYLRGLIQLPCAEIVERWHGLYARHSRQRWFTSQPQAGVQVVTAAGGAGMTLSFGLAEDLWTD